MKLSDWMCIKYIFSKWPGYASDQDQANRIVNYCNEQILAGIRDEH